MAKNNKFLKKWEETVIKIFLFLSLKSVIVNLGFLNLFLDIWIRIPNTDPDPGSRLKLNADPTGSGSETLQVTI
jgi:hypothetical protein